MIHLAVNFHYVGMPDYPYPGVHGCSEDEFRNILERLGERFEFVSLTQVVFAFRDDPIPEKSCLITFDDGLICQYKNALPLLDELNVPAAFFILGAPYLENKAATTHKLHWLRANLGDQAISNALMEMNNRELCDISPDNVDIETARHCYRYDDENTAKLKYALNYLLPVQLLEKLLNDLLIKMDLTESEFIKNYYMSEEIIKELAKRKMIGSHAISHRPLAKMNENEARKELVDSKIFLEQLTNSSIEAVSYPLGNAPAVNKKIGQLAKFAGYSFGYTMERAMNSSWNDPLLLARIDAGDIDRIDKLKFRTRYIFFE